MPHGYAIPHRGIKRRHAQLAGLFVIELGTALRSRVIGWYCAIPTPGDPVGITDRHD